MIKVLLILIVFILRTQYSYSWQGNKISPLHIEGRFLKDTAGNIVVLRGGWMQPIEAWFNGNRYTNPTDWTNPNNVSGLLNFLKEAADLMSDTTPKYGTNFGWYCTFVRINTDFIGGWTHENGLVDQNQFNGWINNFLVPYANHLRSRGLYLVICATGPINTPNNGTRNCGIIEQARLRTFWKTVASAPGIKNADNVMFELMNEPVEIESSPGNGDWGFGQDKYFKAFRDWIQPVIDDIRSTGANNIIWVPTLEWQGSPYQHVRYPFTGTNCGIAAHYYPNYGGCKDNVSCHNNLWNNNYKPATEIWPMIITENFWFPEDNGLCQGSTQYYGVTFKNNVDNAGNVSYLIGFLSDLLVDLKTSSPLNCNLSSKEGSQAAFSWWYGYYKGCEPTTIIPYVQINDGALQKISNITIKTGDKVKLAPKPEYEALWSWTGCNMNATTREIVIYPKNPCSATVMYTNSCGVTTFKTFNIYINVQIEDGGIYSIIARHSGKAVSLAGGLTSNGTNIEQWTYSPYNTNQRFKVINVEEGWYRIVPFISVDKVIEVADGSTIDGANIRIWTYQSKTSQQWKFEAVGDGYFRIIARHSSKCMDVAAESTADGANILQWSCHTGQNQMFRLEKHENTAIIEKNLSKKYIVYPTMANDYIKVLGNESRNYFNIKIFNSIGTIVFSSRYNESEIVINLSKFAPGIYILKIEDKNGYYIEYFMKN